MSFLACVANVVLFRCVFRLCGFLGGFCLPLPCAPSPTCACACACACLAPWYGIFFVLRLVAVGCFACSGCFACICYFTAYVAFLVGLYAHTSFCALAVRHSTPFAYSRLRVLVLGHSTPLNSPCLCPCLRCVILLCLCSGVFPCCPSLTFAACTFLFSCLGVLPHCVFECP